MSSQSKIRINIIRRPILLARTSKKFWPGLVLACLISANFSFVLLPKISAQEPGNLDIKKILPRQVVVSALENSELNWQGTEQALQIDLDESADLEKYNSQNSAVLSYSEIVKTEVTPSVNEPPNSSSNSSEEGVASYTPAHTPQDLSSTSTSASSTTVIEEVQAPAQEVIPLSSDEQEPPVLSAQSSEIVPANLDATIAPSLDFSDFATSEDQTLPTSTLPQNLKLKISLAGLVADGNKIDVNFSLGTSAWQNLAELSWSQSISNITQGGYVSIDLPIGLATRLDELRFQVIYQAQSSSAQQLANENLLSIDGLWLEAGFIKPSDLTDSQSQNDQELGVRQTFDHLDFYNNLVSLSMPSDLDNPMSISQSGLASSTLLMLIDGVLNTATSSRVGNTVTYSNAFLNTDLVYKFQKFGLKEDIVLKSQNHPKEFNYVLNLDSYDYELTGSTLTLFAKGHKGDGLYRRYIMSAPVMVDSAGQESSDIEFKLSDQTLSVIPSASWLESAQYPVIIDPTVEVSVINVHSHPIAGENWNIDFTTSGTADLTITAADQSTIEDMQFVSLMCGPDDKTAAILHLDQGVLSYPNWSCNDVGTISFLDLKTGNHHMIFDFGGQTADAFNSTITWTGAGGNTNWTTAGNWSGGVPTPADLAVFDGTCGATCNATINTTTSIGGLSLAAGYTGTVTQQSTSTITIGASNFAVASGTFISSASTTATSTMINGSFTQTGGTYTAPAGRLAVVVDMTLSGGTFNHNSGTVNFTDTATAQDSTVTCSGTPFNLVTVTKTHGNSGFNISNGASSCTVPLGASPTIYVSDFSTWNGVVTVSSGTFTLNNAGSDYDITLNGSINHSGTGWVMTDGLILGTSSVVTYAGSAASFHNDLNIATGTFPSGLTVTFGEATVGSDSTLTCSGNPFTKVIISKTAGSTAFNINNGASACNVPLGASPTAYVSANSTWNGNVSISSGTFNLNNAGSNYTITLNGNLSHSGTGWIMNDGLTLGTSSVVTFGGTSATFANSLNIATGTFPTNLSLTFNDSTGTPSATLTLPDNYVIAGLVVSKGANQTVTFAGATTTTVTGNISMSSGGALGGFANPTATTTVTLHGNLTQSSGTFGGSRLIISFASSTNSTVSQTATFSSPFTINKTGSGQVQLSSAFTSSSATCGVVTGTFDLNGNNFTCGSTFSGASGATLALWGSEATVTTPSLVSGSTVIYKGDGGATTTFSAFKNWPYYNLTINTTDSGDIIDGSSLSTTTVLGNLSLTSGTFKTPTTLTALGNVSGAAGTITSGTVLLAGINQQITGTTTFYNLTKNATTTDTLTFSAGSLISITGAMNLQGASGNLLSLRSTASGTQWQLNPSGSRTVGYLDVKDSQNINFNPIVTRTFNITNSGNNLGWAFDYLDQTNYQFFGNQDSLSPGGAIGLLNSTTTIITTSQPVRLRMNLVVSNEALNAGEAPFKLQVASTSAGTWSDVNTASSSAWWNILWLKRKPITITNNTTTSFTNFEVRVSVVYATGMNSDFSDVRFTNASQTPLNFWMETSAASASSTMWVQVDSIATSASATIYMYYGNSSATISSSSIGNTFVFGDDFSSSTIDTSKWTLTNSTGLSVVAGELKATSTTGRLTSVPTFSSGNVLEIKTRYVTPAANGYMVGGFFTSTTDSIGYLQGSGGTDFIRVNSIFTNVGASPGTAKNILSTYTVKSSSLVDASQVNYEATSTVYHTNSNNSKVVSGMPIALGERYDNANTGQAYEGYWDWIRVRKYASVDPSASFGSSEDAPFFIFYNNASVSSSTTIASLLLSTSNIQGTYQEGNPSALNPFAAAVGQYVEYDFALSPQSLVSGSTYYFRMVRNDGSILDFYSSYPSLTFLSSDSAPNTPSSLGPASVVGGGYINTSTPSFTFTLTDPDGADTLKYQIQISTSSSFSSYVVDYASSLVAQGSRTFTVGQAAGSGTYYTGSSATILADTSVGYYWRVYNIDNSGSFSASTTANSGSVAFKVDTTAPTAGSLTSTSTTVSSINVSISGASDVTSGLAAAPYIYSNITSSTSTSATSSTSVTFTGLSVNTQYSFVIQVSDLVGNTASTATSSRYTLANIPTSLIATADSQTQITLSFNNNSNPAGTEYYVLNTTASTTSGWITATTYSFSGLTCETSYTFNVKARNGDGTETATTASVAQSTSACGNNNGNSGGSSGGGGGGGLPGNPPTPPAGGFSILINNDDPLTATSSVVLTLNAGSDAKSMAISNRSDFVGAVIENYWPAKNWNLCSPNTSCADGDYTVYAKFYSASGLASVVVSDSIVYSTQTNPPPPVSQPFTVQLAASTNQKLWSTQLLKVNLNQKISLKADLSLPATDDTITYQFDCSSDGKFEKLTDHSKKTTYISRNLCSFSKAGIYTARILATVNGYTAMSTIVIAAGTIPPPTPPPPTYNACQNQACTIISGVGIDSCHSNFDCSTVPPPNHSVCQNSACVIVPGQGSNACALDTDCQVPPPPPLIMHAVCFNLACTLVEGAGTNQCSAPEACQIPPTHLACVNFACASAPGSGVDLCESSADCQVLPPPPPPTDGGSGSGSSSSTGSSTGSSTITTTGGSVIPPIVNNIISTITEIVNGTGQGIGNVAVVVGREVGQALKTGAQSVVLVTSAGLEFVRENDGLNKASGINAVTVAPTALIFQYALMTGGLNSKASNLAELWLILVQLINGFLTAIGLRKRRRYWGTVYDSSSKQPIDPAIVELKDAVTGNVVEQAITDLLGRYGFLERVGQFRITAKKTNYRFPSTIITGTTDGLFDNLYHGGTFNILNPQDVISPNIPMDPLAVDWNQEHKTTLVSFHNTLEVLIFRILRALFWLGAAVTFVECLARPGAVNFALLAIYALLIIIQQLVTKPRLAGLVVSGGLPINNLLIEASPKAIPTIVLGRSLVSQNGKFFLKLPKGEFIIRVKQLDGQAVKILKEFQTNMKKEGAFNQIIKV